MNLRYIYHSGFVLETSKANIVIDFFEDSINRTSGVVHEEVLAQPTSLYVLATHGHDDHFNPDILEWGAQRNGVIYIFSDDIRAMLPPSAPHINFLHKGERYQDDILTIEAYGSTDLGVSFKIEIDNRIIFHAGDLNNWHWNEESTAEEIKEAEDFFARELNEVAAHTPVLDVAIFPVDPRLGKDYAKGATQFLSQIPTRLFVPMHTHNNYSKASIANNLAQVYRTKAWVPAHKGETIIIQ